MRAFHIITRWLFILCLPLVIVTGTVAWAFNSTWLYEHGFEKNRVALTTGFDRAALHATARGLINYFNSPDEYIELTVTKDGRPFQVFNEREAEHLKDVKVLVRLDYRVLWVTGAYVLSYAVLALFLHRTLRRTMLRSLAGAALWGAGLTLVLMAALGLGIIAGFDALFLQFHLFSFANDLWQLDPSRDYLVMLVPRDFWYETFLIGAGVAAGAAVLLGVVGSGYLVLTRKRAGAA